VYLKYLDEIQVWVPHTKSRNRAHITVCQQTPSFRNTVQQHFTSIVKIFVCKSKASPLQAWTGLEGSRRLRLPDFKTVGSWRW